jgi:hypothetical protein
MEPLRDAVVVSKRRNKLPMTQALEKTNEHAEFDNE